MKEIDRKDELAVQALVIANATVDETYSVAKLPATGESLVGQLRARDVGGKGANVATISARCGLRTGLIAVIGKDARGDFVKSKLAQESIVLDLVQSTQCSTDVSLINVDAHGENTIVSTIEAAHCLEASYACQALESLHEKCTVVLQGNLTRELTQLLISKANKFRHRVILNPSPMWPWMKSIVSTADVVFMNAGEAFEITGKTDEAAVSQLLGSGPAQVVLTRGGKSALLGTRHPGIGKSDQIHIEGVPSIRTPVVDTTGAGDTYLAVAIASACRRGVAIDTIALTHAARAAAHTISVHGTHSAFPTSSELANILAS
ncbi:MAG: PfkB family carbohydrate kinase [Granulosicoccus sp.]